MIYEFNVLDFEVDLNEFGYDLVLRDDSILNGTNQYLTIYMQGYFIREGRHCLIFYCQARSQSSLDIQRIIILNAEENELDLRLSDNANGHQVQRFYVETDTDFNVYDRWALTINVSRGGRRGVWKYTKASAKDNE